MEAEVGAEVVMAAGQELVAIPEGRTLRLWAPTSGVKASGGALWVNADEFLQESPGRGFADANVIVVGLLAARVSGAEDADTQAGDDEIEQEIKLDGF